MLSRFLMVTSFMTKMLIDIWTDLFDCLYRQRFVVGTNNNGYILKLNVICYANGSHLRSLHTESSLPELSSSPDPPDPADPPKVAYEAARNPPLLAPGPRMT